MMKPKVGWKHSRFSLFVPDWRRITTEFEARKFISRLTLSHLGFAETNVDEYSFEAPRRPFMQLRKSQSSEGTKD